MKSGLRAALLAAVVLMAATACGPGVYMCACPPNVFPLVVCGTLLNRHGGMLAPAIRLPLSAANRRVARASTRSVIPPPAGWGVTNITIDAITISMNCAHAPVVTVTPVSAARTLAAARPKSGIAALILAQTLNATIVVRAYRGHHLIGKVTIPRVVSPAPPARRQRHVPRRSRAAGSVIWAITNQSRSTACPAASCPMPAEGPGAAQPQSQRAACPVASGRGTSCP